MESTLKIKVKCKDYKLGYTWVIFENWTKDQLAKYINSEKVIEIRIIKNNQISQ